MAQRIVTAIIVPVEACILPANSISQNNINDEAGGCRLPASIHVEEL